MVVRFLRFCSLLEVGRVAGAWSVAAVFSGTLALTPTAPPPPRVSVELLVSSVGRLRTHDLPVRIEFLGGDRGGLGVDLGGNADDDGLTGTDDEAQHRLDLLARGSPRPAAGSASARKRCPASDPARDPRKNAAAIVDDGNLVRTEALHGVGYEVADGVDLVGLEAAAAHVDENGSGGLTPCSVRRRRFSGCTIITRAARTPGELADGAGEFALEGAEVIGALDEVAQAELALVEDFEAHALAARDALAGEIHAELVDACRREPNGRAAGGNLVRDVLRLQVADDGGGILVAHARVEQLVSRAGATT